VRKNTFGFSFSLFCDLNNERGLRIRKVKYVIIKKDTKKCHIIVLRDDLQLFAVFAFRGVFGN